MASKLMMDVLVKMNDTWGGWQLPNASTSYSDIEWMDESTKPTKAEYDAKVAELTPVIAMEAAREHRNELLKESDWSQGADVPQATKDAWATYRQALRDIPQDFPDATIVDGRLSGVTWPTKPEGGE